MTLWKHPCSIYGKWCDADIAIGEHRFCNHGCAAAYQINVKPWAYWIFDLALVIQELTPEDEFRREFGAKIAGSIRIIVGGLKNA